MKRRQHEERVVRIIAAIEGDRVPISEVSVPRARLPIDLVMTLGFPSRAWGPIRQSLSHRKVCVEHFSGSPGIASLSRSLAKHAFVVEERVLYPI
ncbi:MAG: hypothetical protein RBU30_27060 [Polyangia bacterium]|nr:hypothetical protein [Polyangia bacterium]